MQYIDYVLLCNTLIDMSLTIGIFSRFKPQKLNQYSDVSSFEMLHMLMHARMLVYLCVYINRVHKIG